MKILIIQVGNPVAEKGLNPKLNYFQFPTLIEGDLYFDEKQVINNVQTREGLDEMGVEVEFYFHTKRKALADLIKSSIILRRIVKSSRPDITHIYWGGISGFFAQMFCPGKTVVSLLGSDLFGSYHMDGSKILSSRIQTVCSRLTGIFSTRTIVMSHRMKNHLWNSKSDRIVVIPEGLLLSKFTPGDKKEARAKLGWKTNPFTVIFFYEGQAVKNASLAHSAFKIFQKEHPEAVLEIISGYNHEDLVNVYRAADCMIITSFHEGSNNSVKEAMACDLPIVSVACGDAEERLDPVYNSFVTPYKDQEMADRLALIYSRGERSNGSSFIDEVTIATSSMKVAELYKKML